MSRIISYKAPPLLMTRKATPHLTTYKAPPLPPLNAVRGPPPNFLPFCSRPVGRSRDVGRGGGGEAGGYTMLFGSKKKWMGGGGGREKMEGRGETQLKKTGLEIGI